MKERERLIDLLPATTPLVLQRIRYGTAGFRSDSRGHQLDGVAFCCGLVAGLRALERALTQSETKMPVAETVATTWTERCAANLGETEGYPSNERRSSAVGVMITASHNPPEDNGVKLIDYDGGMLEPSWETYANQIVQNAYHPSALESYLDGLAQQVLGPTDALCRCTYVPLILFAHDTRSTSPRLANLAMQGARYMLLNRLEAAGRLDLLDSESGNTILLGTTTTPALHTVIWQWKQLMDQGWCSFRHRPDERFPNWIQGLLASYGPSLVDATVSLLEVLDPSLAKLDSSQEWFVDCANGAGAIVLRGITASLRDRTGIHLVCFNDDVAATELLNRRCGADWVQKTTTLPEGWPLHASDESLSLGGASLDGDADRLICFLGDSLGRCTVLDGDLMATMVLDFVIYCLSRDWPSRPWEARRGLSPSNDQQRWRVGLVHTAYTNGAAVAYWHRKRKEIETGGIEQRSRIELHVVCTWTGVKHLEREARRFDIGIYFEPNGHGTVLFQDAFLRRSGSRLPLPLQCCARLANQAVGDGIANLLLIASLLQWKRWSIADWAGAFYTPLASVYSAMHVPDRHAIKTTDFDRRVTYPPALEASIRGVLEQHRQIRTGNEQHEGSFDNMRVVVRPSGTEDIVRIYVEAPTKEDALAIADAVSTAVMEHLGPQQTLASATS
ncbi:Phosphoglucomutase-3 [Cyanidiococcus yangmingshanensis]|uniref:Phosphoglucomutase-3 n=1 Tax=Cyanidiococcus yangmingshanensis TaxID=2690220 RepID=A0A7J7IM15_9RHOD|nr:Phosphoglucomutase-3 [Cyanidiococcus yangmingshanensis]